MIYRKQSLANQESLVKLVFAGYLISEALGKSFPCSFKDPEIIFTVSRGYTFTRPLRKYSDHSARFIEKCVRRQEVP